MIEIRFILCLLCSATVFINNGLAAESCISQNPCLCQIDDDSKIDLSSLLDDHTQYLKDTKEDITYLFSGCKDTVFNVTVKGANGTTNNENVTASLLLLNNTSLNYTILGNAKGIHFTKNDESKYYEIVYNNNNEVTATIELICDNLKVPFLKTIDSKLKVFALASPRACLVVENQGMSGGSKFVLILFIITLIYFVGGGLVLYLIRGARGLEMIPNIEFWRNLPSLVKDGIIFLLAGCRPTLITSAETYDRI